jgi:rhamnose transport system ATP-binding protein
VSARLNIGMPDLRKSARAGWVSGRQLTERASVAATGFGFDPARLGQPVGELSGGNQQKVLLARWIYARPKVLLCDEPTRGIDISAKEQILASLRTFAGQGLAIVMVSSEFEELISVCDRILVLAHGHVVSVQRPATSSVTPGSLLAAAFDHRPEVECSNVR